MTTDLPVPADAVGSIIRPPSPGLPLRVRLRRAFRHRSLLIGVVLLLAIVVVVVVGPWLTSASPTTQYASATFRVPSVGHWFGTDAFGRDVLARVLYGGRQTVVASVLVVVLGGVAGTVLGVIAGYFRGVVGFLIMRLVDLMLAFPGILLALTVAAILGPGLMNGIISVAIVLVPIYARLVEGVTVQTRQMPYVEAAEAVGIGSLSIIIYHVLPNIRSSIVVLTTSWLGIAALWIASLGFLGLGVQPPTPEWGASINDGSAYIVQGWWISFFPGLFLVLFVVGSNLLGDGLRDVLDPTLTSAADAPG